MLSIFPRRCLLNHAIVKASMGLFFLFVFMPQCRSQGKAKQGKVNLVEELIAEGIPKLKYIRTVKTGPEPKQICFHPQRDEVYITNLGGPQSAKKQLASLQIINSKTWGTAFKEKARAAVECLIDKESPRYIYYTDMFSDELIKFDVTTRKIVFKVNIKEDSIKNIRGYHYRFMPKMILLDGKQVFVSMWLNGVSVLDSQTGKLLDRFSGFCSHPRGMLMHNRELHIMCYGVPDGPGQIIVLDPKTGNVKNRLITGGSPRHIIPYKNERALISNLNSGNISVYNMNTKKIEKSLRVGAVNTIVLDKSKKYLYANDRTRNVLRIVSLDEWKVIENVKTGKYPTGLDVSYDGNFLAVTNFHENNFYLYKIKRQAKPAKNL